MVISKTQTFSAKQATKPISKPLPKKKKSILGSILPIAFFLLTIGAICFAFYTVFPKGGEGEEYKKSRKKDVYEFTGATNKKWVLKGHEFVNGETQAKFTVTVTDEYKGQELDMHWELEETDYEGVMTKVDDVTYEGIIDSATVAPGKYQVTGAIPKSETSSSEIKSTPVEINISYPLYSVWTLDWEGLDVSQTFLNQMDQLSEQHHNMPQTQLFNPAIYAGNISTSRANYLTQWVKDRKASRGDEIGMHMHMWFNMVKAAGVNPRTSNAWRNYGNGRDIPFSEYNYEESVKILTWGQNQFKAHGLEPAVSFRAGGWFADLENLQAMEATGFRMDTSGRDGVAWGDGDKLVPSNWSLSTTTQPYHPSESNLNSRTPEPNIKLWEFPNNGRDSWTYQANDMIVAFNDNLRNGILDRHKTVNFLTHPHWYNVDKPKLEKLFTEVDKHLYSTDSGPVIYTTMEKTLPIWDYLEANDLEGY